MYQEIITYRFLTSRSWSGHRFKSAKSKGNRSQFMVLSLGFSFYTSSMTGEVHPRHLITCMALREAGERHHDNAGGSRKLSAVAADHIIQCTLKNDPVISFTPRKNSIDFFHLNPFLSNQ